MSSPTAIARSACAQDIHKQESSDILLSATTDYVLLKLLLRGVLAVLKSLYLENSMKFKNAQNTERN